MKPDPKASGWKGPAALFPLLTPVASLKPDPGNSRLHTERSIELQAESLRKFGQRKPVVVQRRGMVVRAGNGILAAAVKLGWAEVAAVIIDDDDRTATEFSVTDNRTGELSEWDSDLLLKHLQASASFEALGFSQEDFQELLEFKANPFVTTRVAVEDLKRHPRNYQEHPDDQLEHIQKSIETNGFYRNVVVARDNTILAGHGVVEAARRMGKKRVPVIRLDLDPDEPRALKVLTSDNEIGNLAQRDDRALTELLKNILESGEGLLGTGFTEQSLAALAMVTRTASEIRSFDDAAQWIGMPEHDPGSVYCKLTIQFSSTEARDKFIREKLGLSSDDGRIREHAGTPSTPLGNKSVWWPPRDERNDLKSLRLEGER